MDHASQLGEQPVCLLDVPLRPEYRSDSDDLVDDFYVPCLRASRIYRRAVGYFTSRGLSAAAQGLTGLIEGGGRMLLVASPLFETEDLDAIEAGYLARHDAVLRSLLRQIEPGEDVGLRDRLSYLAWLVAEERLEIRIAVAVSGRGAPKRGIYHEKLGLFEDGGGNTIAFTGSANETAGGLIDNFEAIDVFWSWDDPQGRVARKISNFERLWRNETTGLEVVPFPEAARRRLLEMRPTGSRGGQIRVPEDAVPSRSVRLWQHQDDAIAAFLEHRRGVLEMATGTGKTRTALRICERLASSGAIDTVVVAADGNDLLDQWYNQLTDLCGRLGRAFRVNRQYELHKQQSHFLVNPSRAVLLVSRPSLHRVLRGMSANQLEKTLLIHDEVHRLGSEGNRSQLEGLATRIPFRLSSWS